MKKSKDYELNLLVQNRETGDIDAVIHTKEQYNYWLKYILQMNDIKIAIAVFSEELGIKKDEIRKQWSLPEIVNTLSTRYKIIDMRPLLEERK